MAMSSLILLLKICILFGAVANVLAFGYPFEYPEDDICGGIDPCYNPICCKPIPRLCLSNKNCRSSEDCIHGDDWNGYG